MCKTFVKGSIQCSIGTVAVKHWKNIWRNSRRSSQYTKQRVELDQSHKLGMRTDLSGHSGDLLPSAYSHNSTTDGCQDEQSNRWKQEGHYAGCLLDVLILLSLSLCLETAKVERTSASAFIEKVSLTHMRGFAKFVPTYFSAFTPSRFIAKVFACAA
jgi:hypothetical protein